MVPMMRIAAVPCLCVLCVVAAPLAFAETGSDVPSVTHLSSEQESGLLVSSIECEDTEMLYISQGEHRTANTPICLTYKEYRSLSGAGADLRHYQYAASDGVVLETIHLGLIAPVSGEAWTYGVDIAAGARLAEENANTMLADSDATWRVSVQLVDSRTHPEFALMAVATFADNNYDIIVGPSIDIFGDVSQDAPDSLLVSCCSVALQHAADDNIFRMTPPQSVHGRVMAHAVHDAGYTHIIPVGRDSVWVTDLLASAATEFDMLGGTVGDTILYNGSGLYSFYHMSAIDWEIREALVKHNMSEIAVLYAGFQESYSFLDAIADSKYGLGNNVTWFGADTNTVRPYDALDGAASLNLVAIQPVVGLMIQDTGDLESAPYLLDLSTSLVSYADMVGGDRLADLKQRIGEFTPSVYAVQTYDAVMSIVHAISETGRHDAGSVTESLRGGSYVGVDGNPVEFDLNGDRTTIHYGVWSILDGKWVLTGVYDGSDPAAGQMPRDDMVFAHTGGLLWRQ